MPTRAQYELAKQHQQHNPTEYAAQNPSAEVLANVAIINAYEGSQVDDGSCLCLWFTLGDLASVCTCGHGEPSHSDGPCAAPAPVG